MQGSLKRTEYSSTYESLTFFPAVAVLGARQSGKSTLAKQLLENYGKNGIYLDLEKESDLEKLNFAEEFLRSHQDKLICLDEIQRKPDLFPLLRALIDENRRPGRFLLLGSASEKLLKQSSETLAGRIAYKYLNPFSIKEVAEYKELALDETEKTKRLWQRGGFPNSFLAPKDSLSYEWREQFIKTFIEKDIPELDVKIPALTLKRMLMMIAHSHGQVSNLSKLAGAMGVSHTSIRQYIDLFENTFILRTLNPFEINIKKRLVKSPKIYLRDSGILHTLLKQESLEDIYSHPICGSSWEGFVIENIFDALDSRWDFGFYRTSAGAEIDLILQKNNRKIAIECKLSIHPQVTRGFWQACEDLSITEAYIVAPVQEEFIISQKPVQCTVIPLIKLINTITMSQLPSNG